MQDRHDEFYRPFGNQAYYQGRSGQEGGGRQGSNEHTEEQSNNVPVMGKAGSIAKVSSGIDTISLFA
jgi:hypothetical protein